MNMYVEIEKRGLRRIVVILRDDVQGYGITEFIENR